MSKVIAIGNSLGISLPKGILRRLSVRKGDWLYVLETTRGIELTRDAPELAHQMEPAEQVMREDWDALKRLAE